MFYIFNKDNQCISSCNAKPNEEDLAIREEFVIEDARDLDISAHEYADGVIREKPAVEYVPTKVDKINAIKAEYEPRFKTLEEAVFMKLSVKQYMLIRELDDSIQGLHCSVKC